MTSVFLTIGHSTRSMPEFADLSRAFGAEAVVDVRSMRRSRANPQFNGETLPDALADWQIGYEAIGELGGLRGRQAGADPATNALWRVRSFHNYADYALTAPFAEGFARLLAMGAARRCAIMCAEAVWWRCHRRLIADRLLAAGAGVIHILGPGQSQEARLTPGAVVRGDATVVYPAAP
ncbi:MAG: DUF488 domain-containing protein [Caulobacteraceae bacterium]